MIKDSNVTEIILNDLVNNTPQDLLSLYPIVEIESVDNLVINKQNEVDGYVTLNGSAVVYINMRAENRDNDSYNEELPFTYNIIIDSNSMRIKDREYNFDTKKFSD